MTSLQQRAYKRCAAVLHWRQLQGILLRDAEGYFEARCPSCHMVKRTHRRPTLGAKCWALVPRP